MAAAASEAPIPAGAGTTAPPPDLGGGLSPAVAFPSYVLVEPPLEGEVTDLGDGRFSFSPGRDFGDLAEGERRRVEFSYRLIEQTAASLITVAVWVTGTDAEPIAGNVEYLSVVPEAVPLRPPPIEDGPEQARLADAGADRIGAAAPGSAALPVTVLDPPIEGILVADAAAEGGLRFEPGSDFGDLAAGETRRIEFTSRFGDTGGAPIVVGTVTVTGTATVPAAGPISYAPWTAPEIPARIEPPLAGHPPETLGRPSLPATGAVAETIEPARFLPVPWVAPTATTDRDDDLDRLSPELGRGREESAGAFPAALAEAARAMAIDRADPAAAGLPSRPGDALMPSEAAEEPWAAEFDEDDALLGTKGRAGDDIIDIGFVAGWAERSTPAAAPAEWAPEAGQAAAAAGDRPAAELAVRMGADGFLVIDLLSSRSTGTSSAEPSAAGPSSAKPMGDAGAPAESDTEAEAVLDNPAT